MHSKCSSAYLRLLTLALTGVAAIALALAFGLHRSAASPGGQGKTACGTTARSPLAGTRRDAKADAFLSQPSVRSSLDEIKLTDPEGEELDFSGSQVAISGTTAVVGTSAVLNITEQGKVHIFLRRGDVWELQQTLVFDSRLPENHQDVPVFSLALDKDTLVIAVYLAVYVYVRTGTTWSLQTTFLSPEPEGAPNGGESFGSGVAVSGDTVIVGASWVDDYAGAVYFYERQGAAWSGPLKVSANDHSPDDFGQPFGDFFGHHVAIEGDTAVVAAPGQDVVEDEIDDMEGAAYVYVRNLGTWVEQGYLTPDDAVIETTQQMGESVDISGDTAVVGASLNDRAFVFVRQGTSWAGQQVLTAFDGLTGDFFGGSVGISGDRIVVGSPGNDNDLGAAYLYERTGATWFKGDKLRSTTGVPTFGHLFFGNAVGISGETIIAGAPNEKIEENDYQGAAYIFQKLDSDGDALADDWEEEGITVADNGRVVGTGNLEGEGTFIDLPKMGADPMHKDVFIHVDWMEPDADRDFEPKPSAIAMVIDAFATAPVTNPDLKPGINLHIDFGPDSVMKYVDGESETWDDLSEAGEVPFQEVVDTATPPTSASYDSALLPFKEEHFNPAHRSAVFHYVLYCKIINAEKPGGLGSFRGTDFLLAYGNQKKRINQAGSFMHELGHNLGLDHGGDDDVNYKPNYISVMNYRFQSLGTLRPNGRQRYIDFSREELDTLDETELDENVGINDTAGHVTTWSIWTRPDDPPQSNRCVNNPDFFYRLFYPSAALDWNCDGVRSTTPITPDPIWGGTDLNSDGRCVAASRAPDGSPVLHTTPAPGDVVIGPFVTSGPNRVCETTASGGDRQLQPVGFEEPELLEGFDDWEVLVFDGENKIGRLSGTSAARNQPSNSVQTSEVTREPPLEEIEAELPPALVNEELIAPVDVVTQSLHSGAPPLPVYFDGSASTAVNGTIVDWQWDFGDGTTGSGATVTHTYTALGDYFATLTVTDSSGHVNLIPLLNRVTVNSLQPNLTPFQPPSWSDKIVVSNVTGTNTDSADLTTSNTLYIDLAVVNNGSGSTTTAFVTKLFVDGVEAQGFITNAPLHTNTVSAVQDLAIGPLSAGQHTLTIFADASGAIPETDELDNEYSRIINVSGADPTPTPTPGQPNLTPYQPPGWSDKIVVSNVTGTNTDSATLYTTDSLFIDWAASNNGGAPTTGSFETKLYVDGVEKNTRVTSVAINPAAVFGAQDIAIGSLSAGQHSVRVVLDTGGVISEGNETDNEYIRVINVSPSPIGTNFTVTTIDDNGNDTTPTPGSLRQAILSANASPNPVGKVDLITFNIPGAGIKTIQPPIKLPQITDPVIIDGYTQPGASANTLSVGNNAVLLIELDIESVVPGGGGLAYGFDLRGTGGSTVRGLAINRFQSGGIFISSGNNVVEGCFIGSNIAGDSALPYNFPDNNHNNVYGIFINQGASNRIGGTSAAARNVIAPFDTAIVVGNPLSGATTDTLVQGNYIGTNAAGTATLNTGLTSGYGVSINGASNSTIGGTQLGAGNVISGNGVPGSGFGVSISSSATTGDVIIQGNLIGTNAQGTAAIRNADGGIYAEGTITRLVIGGSQSGARNIISGNGVDRVNGREVLCAGIALYATVQNGATVQGNFIGTGIDGVTLIPNRIDGIGIAPAPNKSYTIGGVNAGEGNIIAGNARHGIQVVALPDGTAGTVAILGNSIFSNGGLSIFGNGGLGIDLQGFPENSFNVTRNDACDGDSGPNAVQNFPVLSAATSSTSVTTITGLLDSKAATTFRIEFFSNALCDGSGQGEGHTFIGSTTVMTGGSCSAGINVTLPSAVPVGQFITATATDPDGNTSEFGPCVQVTAGVPPTAANGSVSGQIVDTNGNAIAGVAINLTGTQNRLAITDGDGNYHFDNVETNGFYTVVPARANYSFVPALRSFNALGSVTEAGFTATPTSGSLNPLDTNEYFVRQQYIDFLGREPDENGLNFWTNQISACGNDATCREARKVNTSAAFFLSIEFQQTGYPVYLTYKSAYDDIPGAPVPIKLDEFLSDASELGHGVVVNQAGWEQVLENNTEAFMVAFVQRPRFRSVNPVALTPAEFVDRLFSNAGVTPAAQERAAAISEFGSATTTSDVDARARILRRVADNATLKQRELNRAFVLMQYFGYLRRNPVDPPESTLDYRGYNFWLEKLTRFGGNFENAEMVKAFLLSGEYRQRFWRE